MKVFDYLTQESEQRTIMINITRYFLLPKIYYSLPITIFFAAGIAGSAFIYPITAALLFGAAVAFFIPHGFTARWYALACLFFGMGAYAYQRQQNNFVYYATMLQGKTIDARATVRMITPIFNARFKQLIKLTISSYKKSDMQWQPTHIVIQIYANRPLSVRLGDELEIHNLHLPLYQPSDYTHYLMKENIHATLFPAALSYHRIKRPEWSLQRWIGERRHALLVSCQKKLSRRAFSFFSLIFLGNKTSYTHSSGQRHFFTAWGISHQLARSGLHLVIFIMLLSFAFNFLPLEFFKKQILICLMVGTYALLSWSSISFIRAFLTFALYKACTFAQLPIQFLHLIMLTTLITLALNPCQLFYLDFQLSFGITGALAWLNALNKQRKQLSSSELLNNERSLA